MTNKDLLNWVMNVHGCIIDEKFSEKLRGKGIKIVNTITGSYVIYNAPSHSRPIKCFTVCYVCMKLNVPVPPDCHDGIEFTQEVMNKNNHGHDLDY